MDEERMRAAEARAKERQRKRHEIENTPREWPPANDVVERWEHNGMECAVAQGLNLCGYVKVPPNHAASGKHYDDVDVAVHGGLTFCQRAMDGGWWLGFDTAHYDDRLVFDHPINLAQAIPKVLPGAKELIESIGGEIPDGPTRIIPGKVWTREDVKAEVEHLADQLRGGDEHPAD